ncbi:hypothetical protein [Comamonas koreensis]|uniref:Glycosyltransferase RgtA/B/C/D-like domain-containing protein n=1 Tax=Comamonas koreensis TaxID=160825 RepID=A0AAW4Y3V8_9BURK|nr:hypothetical protein [Comamonas koreensis]MCD2167804.1 hypothetical protein [Comamonas koreensis]
MAFPIHAVSWASYDDLLFVRQAADIGLGNWLGDYNNLTLSKGIGYSLFMLVNHATGLPLKFSEHAFYLAVSVYFSVTIAQLYRSRVAALVCFFLLAFIPTAWVAGAGGRVVREGLYISQTLLILTLAIRCWVFHHSLSAASQLRRQWRQLVALGLVSGWFWITREEGIWLAPSMLLLMGYWLLRQVDWRTQRRPILAFLALPLVAASMVVMAVNTVNYAVYGTFRNNDFRSNDFQAGYGALTRIRHDNWQRYVLFPKDARERAYEMSSAARELKPFFEGGGAQPWLAAGCDQTQTSHCPEILSGWFMWALRDAVAHAGHYNSARDSRAFYRRLSAEIEEGCRQHAGVCLPMRKTLLPPWHEGYFTDTLKASWAVFRTLATLGKFPAYIQASEGETKYLALFDAVTNGPLAPTANSLGPWGEHTLKSPRDELRMQWAQNLTTAIIPFSTYGLPLAFIAWLLWSAVAGLKLISRHAIPSPGWWVASAIAGGIITRVVLLGFLEATSIPSNNMLYLFPLVPFSLVLLPIIFLGLLRCQRHF